MADLGNLKIKDTYQLVLQTDAGGNLQNLNGGAPSPFIVNGNLRYVDGGQALDYILTSDAVGNASWQTPGHATAYWSANTSGDIFNSGLTSNVGIGTSTPNESLTVVGNISATTTIKIGSTTNYSEFSNQYIKHNGSNRIFLQSSPNTSNPNKLMGNYWGMDDNNHFYWGTDEDLDVYHNGSHGVIDNDTGSLYITSSVLYLGDMTSQTTVQDNLNVNHNLTVSGDLNVNVNTLQVNSSASTVGVGTLYPTHKLTVSGGTSNWIPWNEVGLEKIIFQNGVNFVVYEPSNLTVPDLLQIGGTTVRALVDGTYYYGTTTGGAFTGGRGYFGLTWAGSTVAITNTPSHSVISYGGSFEGSNQFAVYNNQDIALQVSGSTIMSGTTNLLDIFAPYDVISGGTF